MGVSWDGSEGHQRWEERSEWKVNGDWVKRNTKLLWSSSRASDVELSPLGVSALLMQVLPAAAGLRTR